MREASEDEVVRLGAVGTPSGLTNEMLYVPPSSHHSHIAPVLAFFGGDVQDYPEVMASHRDHKHYLAWSLTSTALLLAARFPTHHILVIKPSRMEKKTFSCYDNFVTSNSVGAPNHQPSSTAVAHLASLISEALKVAKVKSGSQQDTISHTTSQPSDVIEQQSSQSCPESIDTKQQVTTNIWTDDNSVQNVSGVAEPKYDSLTLIGFSKGCVVLNQLITEFFFLETVKLDEEQVLHSFINKVSAMYWLDGGHAGGRDTWITTHSILTSLAARQINIHIHVTPYQVHDELRPWIGKECKAFHNVLRRAGAQVHYNLHFENLEPSLYNHFKILNDFA